MQNIAPHAASQPWRLQDTKAQFSALVDNAMRGVPQHVTRSGKRTVVVLSEQDFEALQRGAASRLATPTSFVEQVLPIPNVATDELPNNQRFDVQPRNIDFS